MCPRFWSGGGHRTPKLAHTMSCLHTMMLNVQDCFEQELRLILGDIARDHRLDHRQLIGKYIIRGMPDLSPRTLEAYPEALGPLGVRKVKQSQGPVEIPKPRAPVAGKKRGGRKPKFQEKPQLDGELSREFMTSLTIPLLKEACTLRRVAITGNKNQLIDRLEEYQRDPQAHQPPQKGGRKKKSMAPEPQHNHSLDSQTHPDCEQCKTYGNPMDPEMAQEEFEVSHDIQSQLQDIVKKMNETSLAPEAPEALEAPDHDILDDEEGWEEYREDPLDNMEYGDDLELED